jgi:hypothetical protein
LNKSDLLKQWPWNDSVRNCLWLVVFILAGITGYSFWASSVYGISLPATLIFLLSNYIARAKNINKMIVTLKGCISAQNGETVEGLVCIKDQRSAGIIIMRKDLFILIPVIGRRTKVYFNKITSVTENKLNPIRYLFAKREFTVEVDNVKKVSFGVAESVGKRWAVILNNLVRE